MNAATLFGLALGPLFAAISQVESDNGKTSANVYQIDEDGGGYVADVNRILEPIYLRNGVAFRPFTESAKFDRKLSERMMIIYWTHWGSHYEQKTGKRVTYEVLARIHNGGPIGWKKNATFAYWHKVEAALAEIEAKGDAK